MVAQSRKNVRSDPITLMQYWLFKSEPNVYSIDQLKLDQKTAWSGVRNFQARNFLKTCKKGDQVLFYHSNIERAVVGIAEVKKEAYPEPDPTRKGDWVQVDVGFVMKLKKPVLLSDIKNHPALKNMLLIKQSRLSCMPVEAKEFNTIIKLGS